MVSDFTAHQHTKEQTPTSRSIKMKLQMSNITVFPDIVLEVQKNKSILQASALIKVAALESKTPQKTWVSYWSFELKY